MTYCGARAWVERTENGWIVVGTDGDGSSRRWVFTDKDDDTGEVFSLQEALWQVVECLDAIGSRYDRERISITMRRGDKYVEPEA